MSKERRPLDTRTAKMSAGLLLLLAIALFLAGALSVAGTFLGDPEDRALGPDRAVLGLHVVRAEEDGDGHPMEGPNGERHHRPPGVPALVTFSKGDRERSLHTDRNGFTHLDLRAGTYTVTVQTTEANGSAEIPVRGITHVTARVHDDGRIDFETETHRQHHPPLRPMTGHEGWHASPPQ